MGGRPISASALADGDTGTYKSAQEAAIAGLRSLKQQNAEWGGGVLYNPATGMYAYTQPTSQGDGYHFSARIQMPRGWQLSAIFHTHPSGDNSLMFSGDDVNMAQQLKVPSYILPADDNKIRLFDPTASKVVASHLDPSKTYFNGSIVSESPATDPSVSTSSPQALAQALAAQAAQQTGVK